MARRKNTRRFDPRYFMDEKTDVIQERLSPEAGRNAVEFARKIADTIRQQGGKMHAGDLMDHGVSGQEIRNFIGAIQLDPTVGQLEQGRPDGAKVVLQGDRELAVVEAA